MNWLEFIASLVKSLAWPATATIITILLRKPITQALLSLTHMKYKGLELDFGRELKQLEKEAKAADIAPHLPKRIAPEMKDTLQIIDQAAIMADSFPEPAVTVAWQAIEVELSAAVFRLAISPDFHAYNSALRNAQLLREQNLIDQHTFDLLNRMRELRNYIVHRPRSEHMRTSDASGFIALARGVAEKLKTL